MKFFRKMISQILLKFFRKTILQILFDHLNKPETKQSWVYYLNLKIDLPGFNEEEERKLFDKLIDEGFNEFKRVVKGI